MNRWLRRVFSLIFVSCLIFGMTQTALAAETFKTTDGVNLRTGPSTGSGVIRTIGQGSSVEVLEHDPAGWSKVRDNGDVGYIRSDFLKFPVGDEPAVFKTTTGVNFRAGPSTDDRVITSIGAGVSVDVLEHDPAGWSLLRVNSQEGYVRSDFLFRPAQIEETANTVKAEVKSQSEAKSQSVTLYRTTDGVNFRTGPSTDDKVIKALKAGSIVEMLEHDPNGWSKVRVSGKTGYIKSEFLSAGDGKVELLEWSVAKTVVQTGMVMKVVDVRTGVTYNIRCFSKGGHADVEPLTRADTDAIFKSRNGVWAWDPRPVWVIIGNRIIAASLNGQPHDVSTIKDNGMNGHLCLHFHGTVTNNKSYQKDLNNAVIEAWKAGQ